MIFQYSIHSQGFNEFEIIETTLFTYSLENVSYNLPVERKQTLGADSNLYEKFLG